MTERIVKNIPASILGRLRDHALKHNDSHNQIHTRYAIERLLYRLSRIEAIQHYGLKGATLFATWPQRGYRPTIDLDLYGTHDAEPTDLHELFTRACAEICPEDGILFDAETVMIERVRDASDGNIWKVSLCGHLGRTRITVRIDIGFDDHIYPKPKRQTYPSLLSGLPNASIFMYPPETVIAEKFEAMIRFGKNNTRVKDLYDIWVATRIFSFHKQNLLFAMQATLKRRRTPVPSVMPIGLTEPYARIVDERRLWSAFLYRSRLTLDPPEFSQVQADLRKFFGPIIDGFSEPDFARGRWDHNARVWV